MIPHALSTEHRVEPFGLGEPRPRFSWKLAGERRGAAQAAYRITAALNEQDLDEPGRLIWDSGRQDGAETLLIGWDGPALQSGTCYHWRVEVWDEAGARAGAATTPTCSGRHRTGNSYGDWLQVDAETPRDVLATAYFARSAGIVAEAADVLGREHEAAEYRALHHAIRAAFAEAYVRDDGTVEGGTQTAYLLALGFDLMSTDLIDAAVGHLSADIEKRGNWLTTGFVGVPLLCPVLTEHGRADLAYALLQQDEYPSRGHSIRHGATTIWERWDGWTEHGGFQSAAMNSFNHYSLGSVGDWLYGHVAGIGQAPGSVAYRELLLRPTPGGDLTWARAEQDTARGIVACGWSITDDRLTVTVTVPPGSTAVLEIPTADPGSVREDDAPAAGRPGVLGVETSAAGVNLRLTSGRFTFTATPAL